MSDSEDEAPDKQLKIVIMGDGASGKVRKNKNVGQYPTKNGLSLSVYVTNSGSIDLHRGYRYFSFIKLAGYIQIVVVVPI